MDSSQIFAEYSLFTVALLALVAFTAGFIDAVVGGGGLVQLPFLLINFPVMPLPALFGTNKIASLCGTSVAAVNYASKIKFDPKLLLPISLSCAASSFAGAQIVSHLNPVVLKPLILVILVAGAVYSFLKKDMGATSGKDLPLRYQVLYGIFIGIAVGFYDGFFGPGTGSFFVLGFVLVLGFDFLKASAYAKVVNCITNISALSVFIWNKQYILTLALTLAIFNMTGGYLGSHIALRRGNAFVRAVFLIIVSMMIVKFGYDIIVAHK